MWALEMAQPLRMLLEGVDHGSYSTSFSKLAKKDLEYLGIQEDDMGIILEPGESVLAHTQEFIGTFGSGFTSAMHARSSSGRNFLEVCRCAGLGDEGYFNRWTIELQNNSRFHHIPIIVGRRYAQMVFYQIEPNAEPTTYVSKGGKYQTSQSLEDLKETWDPVDMLPKMHRDREVIGNG
jgi:dCTP deaminase